MRICHRLCAGYVRRDRDAVPRDPPSSRCRSEALQSRLRNAFNYTSLTRFAPRSAALAFRACRFLRRAVQTIQAEFFVDR